MTDPTLPSNAILTTNSAPTPNATNPLPHPIVEIIPDLDSAFSSFTTKPQVNENSQPIPNQSTSSQPPKVSQSILKYLTVGLVDLFQNCSTQFKFVAKTTEEKRVLTVPSVGVHNNGLDNEEGNLILYADSILNDRYYVKELLGQGTFGQVVRCEDLLTKQVVAVKVVKNKTAYLKQAEVEISILDELRSHDPEKKHHIISKISEFTHQNHLCIVIELLGMNLFELIKQNRFKGLSLNVISVFLSQLLDALCVLADANIIHCDLKPENILLTDLSHPKDLIRLIDFGSACHENEAVFSYIQSRFYRAPEVLLGSKYNKSIDMWSLGCICAELFLGLPLLPGVSQYNQVCRIVEMFGAPPQYMIEYGKYGYKYFKMTYSAMKNKMGQRTNQPNDTEIPLQQDGSFSIYEIKSERQYLAENPSISPLEWKRYFNYTKLPDLVKHYGDVSKIDEKEMKCRASFIDFLNGLLQIDPMKRWTADQAKLHPFVTGQEFTEPFVPPQTRHSKAQYEQLQNYLSEKKFQQAQQFASSNPSNSYHSSNLGTPNQPSFLAYGLSPIGSFAPMLGVSPGNNFSVKSNNSYPDQLGTSPYLQPGIPISNSHGHAMNQMSAVGSYGSSFGSYPYGSWGSNNNIGVSPNMYAMNNPYMYQTPPTSNSMLGMSPQVGGASLLGSTPSATGTPNSFGSYGRRRGTSAAKHPYSVDGITGGMQEITIEDQGQHRPRSSSNAKPHHIRNNSRNNNSFKNNTGVTATTGTNAPRPPKHPKSKPHPGGRKGQDSFDQYSEEDNNNWNPFSFDTEDDDLVASSTGSNPYYNNANKRQPQYSQPSQHVPPTSPKVSQNKAEPSGGSFEDGSFSSPGKNKPFSSFNNRNKQYSNKNKK